MDHPVPHDDRDKLAKFWIFGEKGVGKSALVQKFVVSHHSMDSILILKGWMATMAYIKSIALL